VAIQIGPALKDGERVYYMEEYVRVAFQVIVFGLLAGSIYGLFGLGLTLIMGVGKILNVGYGDLGILGAYVAFFIFVSYYIDPLLCLIVVIPFLALLGMGIQKFLINPAVKDPRYRTTASVMITYGLALTISNGITIAWSPSYRFLDLPYAYRSFEVLGTTINFPRLLVLIVTVVVAAGLIGLLKTRMGKSIQAASQDQMLSSLVGINHKRITALTFGISSSLAGIGGVLYMLNNPLYPAVGLHLTIKGLTVMVLGGIGNVFGALIAGLILGLAESMTSFFLGDIYRGLVAYSFLVVVLLLRPSGIFRSME